MCVYVFFPSWSFQNDSAENFYFLNFFFYYILPSSVFNI